MHQQNTEMSTRDNQRTFTSHRDEREVRVNDNYHNDPFTLQW